MPPLPADSIHARACKLKCEKNLTRPQLFARNGWLKRGEALASPLSMSMEVDPMRAMLIAVGHYRQEWTVF